MNKKPLLIIVVGAVVALLGYTAYVQYPFTTTRNVFEGDKPASLTTESARAMLAQAPIVVPEMNTTAQLNAGAGSFAIPDVPVQGSIRLGEVVAVNKVAGGHDVLATFVVNGGGTGNFVYVILFNERDGSWQQGDFVLLGDRVVVQSIEFAETSTDATDYMATVTILDRNPDEAMAAVPTVTKTIKMTVYGSSLSEQTSPVVATSTPDLPPSAPEEEMIACTMDAKMCPDGSYVGRSGPNCEFKCPTGESTSTN